MGEGGREGGISFNKDHTSRVYRKRSECVSPEWLRQRRGKEGGRGRIVKEG